MTAVILNGIEMALGLKQRLAEDISYLKQTKNVTPGLAVIQIGDHEASQIYVASKIKQCAEVGIKSEKIHLKADVQESEILNQIDLLNKRVDIHGILVQMPLPLSLNSHKIIQAIHPMKDVDGLHSDNLGKVLIGKSLINPCTAQGCLTLLKKHHACLNGLHAFVLGRSLLVGKPLALMLLQENCTVTLAHTYTQNVELLCRQADIVVVAVGSIHLVKKSWIKAGAIILDVGINRILKSNQTYDLKGDVDFEQVKEIASAITPVPGGIGPMTVISLLENTVKLMKYQLNLDS